jgi:hypothetical protein
MSTPGFTAEASIYESPMDYRLTTIHRYGSRSGVKPQLEGCSDCMLYTEPGPKGRTAGIRICCTTICKWGFGCVQSCRAELCWTPSAQDIYV